ncbi:uncharacterized protein BDW47DRAFT_45041 [Aspergillus candidus]|uniref:Uncharacterized protein n=1 Tax=Aspergillus candidus TaxID=41067 RepID=A0A2I2F8U6_ASPCN|nr:hypothetical protein BDW47DRAFT_45041 [Aspergillus candidus]PLB37050.1 hypothetical protein BDW47DRAFT_45041 [Aspergillus candidus]
MFSPFLISLILFPLFRSLRMVLTDLFHTYLPHPIYPLFKVHTQAFSLYYTDSYVITVLLQLATLVGLVMIDYRCTYLIDIYNSY